MAIKVYESEEAMDRAFDDMCEANEQHAALKERVEEAQGWIEEAEYNLEIAKDELKAAKAGLVEAEKELEEHEAEHGEELIG